ncbi:MAG TPA: hypothetical protein PKC72_10760 [Chitinophagaceae bacterium]|nr:hypothetical protein [Chitinophagaceae bacterium]
MADVHDKTTRSYNMSRINAKNTKQQYFLYYLTSSIKK